MHRKITTAISSLQTETRIHRVLQKKKSMEKYYKVPPFIKFLDNILRLRWTFVKMGYLQKILDGNFNYHYFLVTRASFFVL